MLHKSFSRINELLAMALRSKRATSDELKKASKMYQQAYDFLLENAWLDLTEVLFFYRKHLVESQYICVGHNNALHPTSSDIDLQEEAVKLLAGFTPARQRPERFQCMGHPHVFSRIQVNHTGAHFFNSFMKGLDSVVALTT